MSHSPIKLIAGLGNPGEEYAKTRHNAGFLFVARLADQLGSSWSVNKNCFGRVANAVINGHSVRLLLPDTFMNLSGKAVQATLHYFKLDPSELLVVHDELDLAPGTARLKLEGGHGGNNGVRDVIQKLGSGDFARLRIGIGHPGEGRDVSGFVLKRANKADQAQIEDSMTQALRVMDLVVEGSFDQAMNELHPRQGGS